MLKGYSILIGEIVPADMIDHGDCADEQITCPHCHEPVFKVAGSHRAQGYLSHYAIPGADVAHPIPSAQAVRDICDAAATTAIQIH